VRAAAIAGNHPLDVGFTNSFVVVGREAESRDWPEIAVRRVTPEYFATLRVPLRRGRLLADSDHTRAAPVLLINDAAAGRFFAGRDPLGQRISFWGQQRTVVGVIGDEKFHGLAAASPPAVYTPLAQTPSAGGGEALLVRADSSPVLLASGVRSAVRALDPELALFGVEALSETVSQSVGERRFLMLVLSVFAALALLLAAVGVHGVLSYNVARRTREIGVRMALGAQAASVVALVVRQGFRLTLLGLGLGLAGALLFARALGRLLFGVTSTDPVTFLAVVAVIAGVALLASYLPARRAVRVDPLAALRAE
jgi:predicted permease